MRRPLDLLDQPFFASQQALLTADGFRRAAEDRGVRVDAADLEALHRHGHVVPFFGIRYDPRTLRARDPTIGRDLLRAALDFTSTGGEQLQREHEVGDLFDPTTESFVPYRLLRRSYAGRQYERVRYVYSPYQLLQLKVLRDLPDVLHRRQRGKRVVGAVPSFARQHVAFAERHYRRLLIPLHALETIYRPAVIERVRAPYGRSPSADPFRPWDDLRRSFDPVRLLSWIGWRSEDVLAAAERLLVDARSVDPLRAWEDLVGLVHPERWLKLRGDGLMAVDHKIAAEMLLRFYEELAEASGAGPLEPLGRWRAPRHSRLYRDRAKLPEVLTRYDLSPHPAVVLVLEGATEMLIMPRVLDMLSSKWRSYVELVDAEGVTRSLDPLVAYAATPRLLREEGRGVLMRPPVRVLVVMDPEGPYQTQQQRERRQRQWLERIRRALPRQYQTARVDEQLRELIEVRTWTATGLSFEFAHWTDAQLARAVLRVSPNAPVTLPRLASSIGACRRRRAGLESIWHNGWPPPHPAKPAIADALWPALERRVITDSEREHARVPALRIARRALDLARRSPRYLVHHLEV